MARSKNKSLPHHVKERLRHQNLQKILENVANYVPKPTTTKKETKAKKLRRVVLYLKYLIHKKEELLKSKPKAIKKTTKCQDIAMKTNVIIPELSYVHKPKSKRAHIVFLTKSFDTLGNNHGDAETRTRQKSCNTEKEQEIHTAKNTVNVLNESNPKNHLSPDNGLELFHEKPDKFAADRNDRYIPNIEMEKPSDYDDFWKEGYSTISVINAKRNVEKAGSSDIIKNQVLNEGENCFIDGKESIIYELGRNETNLERYIQEFSRDLEKIQGSASPHKKMFLSNNLESSCADIYHNKNEANFNSSSKNLSPIEKYSSNNREKSCSFSESETLKNYHSGYDVQMDKNQCIKLPLFSQSSNNFSSGKTGTFTYLNNFEMPYSFNNSVSQKNGQQYCAEKIDKHQHSKFKMFAQRPYNFSPDFFSSEESGTLTSLLSFESQKSDQPNYCGKEMETHQFSKHPSFSQSSDNFSSDIFSSGESGTLMSSNEYLLSENEHIGFKDIRHPCSNESPSESLRPEYVIDEAKYDYSPTSPQRSCDTISSPDIFCDMKQDIPRVISNFSVHNVLSKGSNISSPSLAANSERFLEYNIQEPNYSIPLIHDVAYNYVDSRFINYFGMNNNSQSLPLIGPPPFAQIGNCPTLNKKVISRYCNTVPNDENYIIDNYSCRNTNDCNFSMYVNEDVENYLDGPIKQEIGESFLPPEELSYSLNNLTNSDYCWLQKDLNIH
ncbi:uncharacterized protein LOC129990488 [Argiope bruennichi]|uniref:BHLH domain-containing protein n=1 Tax=Argiope bruennichi TaxID=94029 RepID=A0A8T0FZW0_ARGBR|nr:uncharacterized protein LOC129990488 [Argiope bruennichi]KAF8795099.1 hypothetical protein HNY73_002987 [Argiope bruennichi]